MIAIREGKMEVALPYSNVFRLEFTLKDQASLGTGMSVGRIGSAWCHADHDSSPVRMRISVELKFCRAWIEIFLRAIVRANGQGAVMGGRQCVNLRVQLSPKPCRGGRIGRRAKRRYALAPLIG